MGFSLNPEVVEGNLFNEDGKWKYQVALNYKGLYNHFEPIDATRLAWSNSVGSSGVTLEHIPKGWFLVVLEPYHIYSHPVMIRG